MRTSKCFVGLLLMSFALASLFCQTSLTSCSAALALEDVVSPASHSSAPVNAADKFSLAVGLAEEGHTAEAFRVAKEAKELGSPDRFLSVNYVNTLVTIADQKDKSHDVKILNEAIQEINEVKASKIATGEKDPEVAYHTMIATGRLADALLPRSEKVASSLMIEEGTIATKLKKNPMYPKESLAVLSTPLFHQAKAYAIQDKPEDAFRCLVEAFELGFVKFDEVLVDEHLSKLADQDRLQRVTRQAKDAYLTKVEAWSRRELSNFRPFPFDLNVAGLNRGRMTQEDFPGKVLVIELWATWCTPCREALPHFVELAEEFDGEGVQVLGVSMDNPEDPSSVRTSVKEFVVKEKLNFPIALGDVSVTDQLPGKQLLPTTIFVDRSGNVRYTAIGVHDMYQLSAIANALARESEAISTQFVD